MGTITTIKAMDQQTSGSTVAGKGQEQ